MKSPIQEILFFGIVMVLAGVVFTVTVGPQFHSLITKDVPSNLEVDISQGFKQILPGEELWFTVKYLNLANEARRDVTISYAIYDNNRNEIVSKSETVAVETQASFVGKLQLPKDSQAGRYYIRASLVGVDGAADSAESEATFIVEGNATRRILYYIGIGVLLVLLIGYAGFQGKTILDHYRLRRTIRRIVLKKLGKEISQ